MIFCIEYEVHRGNLRENAEWLQEELRSLPPQVRVVAGGYDDERSRGWSLVPRLDQAVWWLQAYGQPGPIQSLTARVRPVSEAEELPSDLASLLAFLGELRYARTVLGAEQEDPFYLVHAAEQRALAEDVALLARYAHCGRARLLSASRPTAWEEADASYEARVVPGHVSVPGKAAVRVADYIRDLTAVRALVDRLRAAPPQFVDLVCDDADREAAERLHGLLLLTSAGYPRIQE